VRGLAIAQNARKLLKNGRKCARVRGCAVWQAGRQTLRVIGAPAADSAPGAGPVMRSFVSSNAVWYRVFCGSFHSGGWAASSV
jgi:hypothetical protein